MHLSVLIPTYRRPEHLRRALDSISRQEFPVSEVIVGVRDSDEITLDVLREYSGRVTAALVSVPGVIVSMQAALNKSTGDIVAIIDDDVELLPDWTSRVAEYFSAKPRLGLLGGRDLLQDNLAARAAEARRKNVGKLYWYGNACGNHHCGIGGYREVDVLKGCNIAGRGALMRSIGFEKALRGQGAQVAWELAFCLDIKMTGHVVAYDSELQVRHFVAPRFDADVNQRGGYSGEALYDDVFNHWYCYRTRLPAWRTFFCLLWAVLLGNHHAPGLAQYLRIKFIRRDPNAEDRLVRVLKGIGSGLCVARRSRSCRP